MYIIHSYWYYGDMDRLRTYRTLTEAKNAAEKKVMEHKDRYADTVIRKKIKKDGEYTYEWYCLVYKAGGKAGYTFFKKKKK